MDEIVLTPTWARARDRACGALLAGERLLLVTGPAGTGKTLLLEDVARLLLAAGWSVSRRPNPGSPRPCAILIDDADRLSDPELDAVARNAAGPVLLVGSAALRARCPGRPHIALSALPEYEAAHFIHRWLTRTGNDPARIDPAASALILAFAGGIPRALVDILRLSCWLADLAGVDQVTARHVEVARKLRDHLTKTDPTLAPTAAIPKPANGHTPEPLPHTAANGAAAPSAADHTVRLATPVEPAVAPSLPPPPPVEPAAEATPPAPKLPLEHPVEAAAEPEPPADPASDTILGRPATVRPRRSHRLALAAAGTVLLCAGLAATVHWTMARPSTALTQQSAAPSNPAAEAAPISTTAAVQPEADRPSPAAAAEPTPTPPSPALANAAPPADASPQVAPPPAIASASEPPQTAAIAQPAGPPADPSPQAAPPQAIASAPEPPAAEPPAQLALAQAPEPTPRPPEPPVESGLAPEPNPPAPTPALAPASPLPQAAVDMLLRRGNQAVSLGDYSAARLLFGRAAAAGNPVAMLAMGRTYDPDLLTGPAAQVSADKATAAEWYRKAAAAGNPEASVLLARVERP